MITFFDSDYFARPSSSADDGDNVESRSSRQRENYEASAQQLGPFFGYFNNLSFNDQLEESSCPTCQTCNNTSSNSTCPACPGAMAGNQVITSIFLRLTS